MHHKQALQHYWKNEDRVNQLAIDYKLIGLEPNDLLLCELAFLLTTEPSCEQVEQTIEKLFAQAH